MTKIAYLECPTGIAGDMCLGALVDLGVPLDYLADQLSRLGIAHEYRLRSETVHRNTQRATKVHVELQVNSGAIPAYGPEPTRPPQATSHTAVHSHDSEHSHLQDDFPHHHHMKPPSHTHHSHPSVPDQPRPLAPIRHLPEIERLILAAQLPHRAEQWSLAVFRQLAVAEGAVHGVPPEQVHFHEVGATDAIVDIVGTCLGLDYLGIEHLYCSALPTGGGTIRAAHGRLPVPSPAVLQLWQMRQVPIYSNGIEMELVTPTGAAIVTTLATDFGAPPPMRLQQVGLGAGSRELPLPNILRLWLGETQQSLPTSQAAAHLVQKQHRSTMPLPESVAPDLATDSTTEPVAVLETQIDDLSPQAIGYVCEQLLQAGVLDVFTQAIAMKKFRLGSLLTVICRPEQVPDCHRILFQETSTLGIRQSFQQRQVLPRAIQSVATPYGPVRVKVAWMDTTAEPSNVQPEYDDCLERARQHQVAWRQVHHQALQSWYADHS